MARHTVKPHKTKKSKDFSYTNINFSIYDFELFLREMNGEEIRSGDKEVNVNISHPSKYLGGKVKVCPKCDKEYSSMDNFCDICGTRLIFLKRITTHNQ